MGHVFSSSSAILSPQAMSTSQEVDFQLDQMKLISQAQAAGRAEALAQANATGLLSGGQAATGPSMYLWMGLNQALHALSYVLIPLSFAAILAGMFIRFSPLLMFAAMAVFFIFCTHFMLLGSAWGFASLRFSSPILWALGVGTLMAAIGAFGVYMPFVYNTEDGGPIELKIGVGAVGGLFLLLMIMFSHRRTAAISQRVMRQ